MTYFYELGYGSYEESAFAQLVHDKKFSQKQFEDMVLRCTVKAAKEEHFHNERRWAEDYASGYDYEWAVNPDREIKAGRVRELEDAMKWRLKGDEGIYLMNVRDARFNRAASLTYQNLHDAVVKLMCADFGFRPLEFLHRAGFFGWADLSVHKDWGDSVSKGGMTERATRLVRKNVVKNSHRFGDSSAGVKWRAAREKALRKNPAAGDAEDEALCKELGVEFVPYNHPDAVSAREALKKKDAEDEEIRSSMFGFGEVEQDFLKAFGVEEDGDSGKD